jgi:hypothetical protein
MPPPEPLVEGPLLLRRLRGQLLRGQLLVASTRLPIRGARVHLDVVVEEEAAQAECIANPLDARQGSGFLTDSAHRGFESQGSARQNLGLASASGLEIAFSTAQHSIAFKGAAGGVQRAAGPQAMHGPSSHY